MSLLAGIAGGILVAVVLWDAFETIVLPRRVTRRVRLTRFFYRATWRPFAASARFVHAGGRREAYLGFYGPLSLLLLLVLWAAALVLGFGLLQYAAAPGSFTTDVYMSGTTFFTLGLGDVAPRGTFARVLTVVESGLGFGFLAIVIGYFPVLYQAFSRREVSISLLDARAGSPPSAAELPRRRPWTRWTASRRQHSRGSRARSPRSSCRASPPDSRTGSCRKCGAAMSRTSPPYPAICCCRCRNGCTRADGGTTGNPRAGAGGARCHRRSTSEAAAPANRRRAGRRRSQHRGGGRPADRRSRHQRGDDSRHGDPHGGDARRPAGRAVLGVGGLDRCVPPARAAGGRLRFGADRRQSRVRRRRPLHPGALRRRRPARRPRQPAAPRRRSVQRRQRAPADRHLRRSAQWLRVRHQPQRRDVGRAVLRRRRPEPELERHLGRRRLARRRRLDGRVPHPAPRLAVSVRGQHDIRVQRAALHPAEKRGGPVAFVRTDPGAL